MQIETSIIIIILPLRYLASCASTWKLKLRSVADSGALSLPDIGQIFPDTDPKWKGASSDIFVREAIKLMREKGYTIGNIDCTIIAQKPKLSPHKEDIRCES